MTICPIPVRTRAVLVKTEAVPYTGEALTGAEAIRVISVSRSQDGEEIDRSDVHTPRGGGARPIQGGRRQTFEIQCELYPTPTLGVVTGWEHAPLMRACPVQIIGEADPGGVPDVVRIVPSASGCAGSGVAPCTIEVHEVGGNVYRATGCTGTVTISADPGQRVLLTFELSGTWEVPVASAGVVWSPGASLPLLYRASALELDPLDSSIDPFTLANCPSFEFIPGIEPVEIPSACTPDGGGWSYVDHSVNPTLAFSGVIAQSEATQPVWRLSESTDGVDVEFVVARWGASGVNGVTILMPGAGLNNPELSEVDRFVGNDVTFVGSNETSVNQYEIQIGVLPV